MQSKKIIDILGTIALAICLGGGTVWTLQSPAQPKTLYLDCYSDKGIPIGNLQTTDTGLLRGHNGTEPFIQCMDDKVYAGDLDVQ